MKYEWLAYVIVAVLSAGLAVAITGVPSSESAGATIVPPETTVPLEPAPVLTTVADVEASDPPETTAAPTTTTAPATTVPAETTTTTTLPPLPDRSELAVVVANGAGVGGLAGSTAEALEEQGYVDVSRTDGTEVVDVTTVYFFDTFEASAARLAVDLGLDPTAIAPVITAPEVLGTAIDDADLLVYLGTDRA